VPDLVQVTLDVPGEAHLPKDYVEADDARLEAYRRLAGVTSIAELGDLRDEWLDRYGALPAPATGLLELSELRLACSNSTSAPSSCYRRAWAYGPVQS